MNVTGMTTGRPGCEAGQGGAVGGDRAGPAAPPGEACGRILTARHAHLAARLPRIRLVLLKVTDAHAGQHPELHRVLTGFGRFADALAGHLGEADHVLFPLVGRAGAGEAVADELAGELAAHGAAHARLVAALDEIALRADGFTPPADACDTYRAVMDELRALAADVRRTIAEEDEVLFAGVGGRGVRAGGRP